MIRAILIAFIAFLTSFNLCAQSLMGSLVEARNLINQGQNDKAELILNQIESQCVNNPNDSIQALFYGNKGIILWGQSKFEACIPYYEKAILLYEKLKIKKQDYLKAFEAIAFSYERMGYYEDAERYYRRALVKSVIADNPENYKANIYLNLGEIYQAKGDTLLASECFRKSADNSQINFGYSNWIYSEWEGSLWNRINELVNTGYYDQAASLYLELIDGIKKQKGENEVYVLALNSRAVLLSHYLKNYDDAICLYKEVISFTDKRFESNEQYAIESICGAYCNLALCYAIKGNYNIVENMMHQGLNYLIKSKVDHYPPNIIYRFAGNGAYWTEDYGHAIKYYEQYLDPKYPREKGANYEEITNQLSVSYILSKKPQKAEMVLLSLLKTDENRLQNENPILLATIYHNMGRALMLEKRFSNALSFLEKSKNIQVEIFGDVSNETKDYIEECENLK